MLKCTYCNGTSFYEGPSGGLSTNVLCANDECRHWFNDTPMGFEDLHRIEPSTEERAAREAAGKKQLVDQQNAIYEDGRRLFHVGSPARDCLTEERRDRAAARDDLLRLTGYIDASRAGVG